MHVHVHVHGHHVDMVHGTLHGFPQEAVQINSSFRGQPLLACGLSL